MNRQCRLKLYFRRITVWHFAALLLLFGPFVFRAVRGQSGLASTPSRSNSNTSTDLPKYEVATFKPPSPASDGRSVMRTGPDGIRGQELSLEFLLREGFNTEDDRIIGAPSWIKSKLFDIEAKVAPEDAPKLRKLTILERNAMLIPLLVECCNLKYHEETRELPTFALVVPKGRPRLAQSKIVPAPSPESSKDTAGLTKRSYPKLIMRPPGSLEAEDLPLSMLVRWLTSQVGRTVVDETGLTGEYDFTLQWTPDDGPLTASGPTAERMDGDAGNSAQGVSLFTALEEQLGLKLVLEKGNVGVIVIDHIDSPSPN
jgi:uncharacterized protein (TIGR03435 family)